VVDFYHGKNKPYLHAVSFLQDLQCETVPTTRVEDFSVTRKSVWFCLLVIRYCWKL